MGFFDRLFATEGDGRAPHDDFWYGPTGAMTVAGVRMTVEGAKKVSAWFRGREILATSLAMLPLQIYERLPNDEGPELADRHPLHDVVHRKPNPWQDSFRWRRQAMYHLIDHGNAYCRMVDGSRGFANELWPIHPTCVQSVRLTTDGMKVFQVRDPETGITRPVTSNHIFHLCGMSDDGIVGKGILDYARESLGLHLVTEHFAQRVFSRGTISAGAIKVPGLLNPEASKRMAESFATSMGDWHLPKVLEQGAEWTESTGMTPENAQMLNSRKFGINEMARFLGVPPHMLADLDRSTNNNIEHQGQEFIDYTEGPWLSLWEFAINDQLIALPQKYYAEFNRNALVRGDIATRWAAYVDAVSTGTFTRNEIRRLENRKKLPGLDEPINPAHLTGKPSSSRSRSQKDGTPPQAPADEAEARLVRAEAIATESAARLIRKEVSAVQKEAVRHAADGDAFAVAITEFYSKHVDLVSQTLRLPRSVAGRYCASQAQQIVAGVGLAALETWQTGTYAAGLAALALDEEAA